MAFTERLALVISASTQGAIAPIKQLEAEANKTGQQFVKLSNVVGVSMSTLKQGLVAGAAALAGVGLVSGLQRVVDGFVESQAAAGQFARAMNSSVEEAGKLSTVMRAVGVDTNDLIELNAEFSRTVQTNTGLLKQLGVELQRNADGSVNMARTLVSTLDALGAMQDGLKAAQIAAQLFGEEGSKQLFAFYSAGIKVSDLMKKITFVDASDTALKFKAATLELNLAMSQLTTTAGAKLVPVLTDVVELATSVINVFSKVPLATTGVVAAWGLLAFKGQDLAKKLRGVGEALQSVVLAPKNVRTQALIADTQALQTAMAELDTAAQKAAASQATLTRLTARDAAARLELAAASEVTLVSQAKIFGAVGATTAAEERLTAAIAEQKVASQLAAVATEEHAAALLVQQRALDAQVAATARASATLANTGGALAAVVGKIGVFNVALAIAAGELILVTAALDAENKAVQRNAAGWQQQAKALGSSKAALAATAAEMAHSESILARYGAALKSWSAAEIGLAVTTAGLSIPFTNLWQAISGGSEVQDTFARDLKRTTDELGAFAGMNLQAEHATKSLQDAVTSLLTGFGDTAANIADVAAAAGAANTQLLQQARITDATATAMGKYAASVQQAVKYQQDLVSRKGDVQSTLAGLTDAVKGLFTAPGVKVKDLPGTFQDEWEAASVNVVDNVYSVIQAMSEVGLSGDQIIAKFKDMGVLDNLPKDVRTQVQKALDEIKGLPTERVMDFIIKPKVDFGGKDFAQFLKEQGDRAADPTQYKKLMDEFRAQQQALNIPVTQDVKVKVDDESLKNAQGTVTGAFATPTPAVVNPVVGDVSGAKNTIVNGIGDVPISIVPAADKDAANTERGWLETTLGPTIAPPVVPVVHDTKAQRQLDQLTGDRTMTVTVKYKDAQGNPITLGTPPTPQSLTMPGMAAVSYGPSYSLRDVTIQASDPMALGRGIERQARRRRLVGMPS